MVNIFLFLLLLQSLNLLSNIDLSKLKLYNLIKALYLRKHEITQKKKYFITIVDIGALCLCMYISCMSQFQRHYTRKTQSAYKGSYRYYPTAHA